MGKWFWSEDEIKNQTQFDMKFAFESDGIKYYRPLYQGYILAPTDQPWCNHNEPTCNGFYSSSLGNKGKYMSNKDSWGGEDNFRKHQCSRIYCNGE